MQNPLEAYRRAQRDVRRHFEPFTRANCPTCPTPCCRRPARIAPSDILLAEAHGWKANPNVTLIPLQVADAPATDMVADTALRLMDTLTDTDYSDATPSEAGLPCEHLGDRGCTFPSDLRPFGCTAYICRYMYARMDRPALTRLKRAVRDLEEKHDLLMRSLERSR